MRAFGRAYPDILNRTYDLPRGSERSVWFGREVSTADAAILLDDAPAEIFDEIVAYDTPRLVKILARTEKAVTVPVGEDRFDLIIGEGTHPAVEISAGKPSAERSGIILVAYEDEALRTVLRKLSPLHPELITPGRLPEPWRYVPEVQMPTLYSTAAVTVIVGGRQEVGIDVRTLLPAASGSPTIEVVPAGVQADWPEGLIWPATAGDRRGASDNSWNGISHDPLFRGPQRRGSSGRTGRDDPGALGHSAFVSPSSHSSLTSPAGQLRARDLMGYASACRAARGRAARQRHHIFSSSHATRHVQDIFFHGRWAARLPIGGRGGRSGSCGPGLRRQGEARRLPVRSPSERIRWGRYGASGCAGWQTISSEAGQKRLRRCLVGGTNRGTPTSRRRPSPRRRCGR